MFLPISSIADICKPSTQTRNEGRVFSHFNASWDVMAVSFSPLLRTDSKLNLRHILIYVNYSQAKLRKIAEHGFFHRGDEVYPRADIQGIFQGFRRGKKRDGGNFFSVRLFERKFQWSPALPNFFTPAISAFSKRKTGFGLPTPNGANFSISE